SVSTKASVTPPNSSHGLSASADCEVSSEEAGAAVLCMCWLTLRIVADVVPKRNVNTAHPILIMTLRIAIVLSNERFSAMWSATTGLVASLACAHGEAHRRKL